ncbi:MAG: glutamate racemase [Lutimonas sp.]
MNKQPIGIFDSGLGGLTVWREVHRLLPNEDIIYLADSKNAPYGEKSKQEIIDLCFKNTEYLLSKGCKLIVVACNTASTNAVAELRAHFPIPFIRIQPAIKPAALQTKTKSIGILATKGTLTSELFYENTKKFAQGVTVVEQVGNGIVNLMEEGKMYSEEMDSLLKKYLYPMLEKKVDHIVLGCTHYPFLIPQIKEIIGYQVAVLDTGEPVARQTKNILIQENLLSDKDTQGRQFFYVNKDPKVFQNFLDKFELNFNAEQIDF